VTAAAETRLADSVPALNASGNPVFDQRIRDRALLGGRDGGMLHRLCWGRPMLGGGQANAAGSTGHCGQRPQPAGGAQLCGPDRHCLRGASPRCCSGPTPSPAVGQTDWERPDCSAQLDAPRAERNMRGLCQQCGEGQRTEQGGQSLHGSEPARCAIQVGHGACWFTSAVLLGSWCAVIFLHVTEALLRNHVHCLQAG
jgi:hypothetical protein